MLWLLVAAVLLLVVFGQAAPQHPEKRKIIQLLTKQCARWSLAAKQDKSIMVAVLHANYGAGYLWALKEIASDAEIRRATGVDVKKLVTEVTKVQAEATKRMVRACPDYAPNDSSYIMKLSMM